MPRMLAAALAAVAALLVATAGAHAASLTFVKDHDVWIANPDGSNAVRVTDDGSADEPWTTPTQSRDGVIAAVKGFHVHLLRQNGEEIRSFVPGNPEPGTFPGTGSLDFSPNGSKLAYAKVTPGCGTPECSMRGVSAVMDLEGKVLGQQQDYTGAFPSWISDTRVLSHGGFNFQNMIWDYETDVWTNWFDDYDVVPAGTSTDLGDGEVSANHASYVAIRGYGDDLQVATYRVNGSLGDARPSLPTPLCYGSGAVFSSPTVSGDGSTAFWQEPDGVWTFGISPDCPDGRLLIAGASEPDWSAADVNPPTAAPAKGGKGKAAKCKKLKGKRKRACLRRARR